jgi:hypothetical protein
MAADFVHFFAMFIIASIIMRLLQIKFADSEWGKALAFIQ